MDTATLTVEDIDSMGTDAQMDALAAEFIMGWERHSEHLWWDVENSQWWSHDAVEVRGTEVDSPNGPVAYSLIASFNPSTGIFDAWEVVEQLEGSGNWSFLLRAVHDQTDAHWYAEFWPLDDNPARTKGAYAATAALAICKAALKAVLAPKPST